MTFTGAIFIAAINTDLLCRLLLNLLKMRGSLDVQELVCVLTHTGRRPHWKDGSPWNATLPLRNPEI